MLTIIIEGEEVFDNETERFGKATPDVVIDLEHSLVSLSKWESKFQKPFLASGNKAPEEIFEYLKCMIVTPGINPNVLLQCSDKNIEEIQSYIDSSQSATTFGLMPERRGAGEIITSELIYFWMVAFNIPFECQNWHLNRLFALIRICNIKQSKPQQMSRAEMARRNKELNEKRKRELGTRG